MDKLRSATSTTFSIVVTAPKGIAHCLIPNWLLSIADGEQLEIVVADGRADSPNRSATGLRHLNFAGDNVFALRRKGLAHTRNEWVILLEDHTRPMPNFLEEFEKAIAAHPQAELISGAAVNDTSTTPSSWSHFLSSADTFWPQSRRKPRGPSTMLLAIRRDLLATQELLQDGGFEIRLLPRLARSGHWLHCEYAIVDHVQENTLFNHCVMQFHNARCSSVFARQLGRSFARSVLAESLRFAYGAAVRPLRVMVGIRGTPQFHISHLPRLVILGLAAGLGRMRGLWGSAGDSPYRLA